MDANGTRYALLLGRADWTVRMQAAGDADGGVEYDDTRGELALAAHAPVLPAAPGDRAPDPRDRRGAARDRFGSVYWIEDDRRAVRVQSAGTGGRSRFWPPAPRASRPPAPGAFTAIATPPAPPEPLLAGVAVTPDHHLVVGTLDPAGVLVFDLHGTGAPRRLSWDAALTPFDLCARSGGGVAILDRERRTLWELDRRLNVVARRELTAGGDPIAIETAPGGILVLERTDSGPSRVRHLAPGAATGPAAELADPDSGVTIVGHDLALAAGPDLGTLYVADHVGNQAFAGTLTLAGDVLTIAWSRDLYPMRLFGGRALVATPDGALYDVDDRWVPLTRRRRARFVTHALLESAPFDGTQPGTVWHRVLLDAAIPPQTAVTLESRAADEASELADRPWQTEPALVYRRGDGSELPYADEPYDTYELLFQRARGRWLQLRMTLRSDGRTTPRLRALRVYHPRFSYLERYLPAVYGEDPDSASFLERFLANLEGLHTTIEDRVSAAQVGFDPRTAPADTLDWLLGWFDLAADPTWHEERRRLFLRHAAELLALRGTAHGIRVALRLALDACDGEHLFAAPQPRDGAPRIVERFRTRVAPPPTAAVLSGPRMVAAGARWEPSQGRDALLGRWRAYSGEDAAEFPLAEASARWRAFTRAVLGFEPATGAEPVVWAAFLAQRHARIEALNAAYGETFASFDAVGQPAALPADGAPLRDWYDFVAVVLPARRVAHRFTVLLPVPPAEQRTRSPEELRAIVERVVELQKPAHTSFDVRFFWAAFRVGEARLGEDTLLDLGSRDPRLLEPLVLGREHAGETRLGGVPAPTAGRAGRDPLPETYRPLTGQDTP